jgi:mannobiose 2-epimerase
MALNSVHAQTFNKTALATDIDTMMINHYLKKYYPAVVDKQYGGILTGYDRQFNMSGTTDKCLDMESRHLWSSSMGMMLHPEYSGFKQAADSAFYWIENKVWDKRNGGSAIHSGTNRQCTGSSAIGQYGPQDNTGLTCDKPLYHEGFALTGLSAYYMATKDTMALYIAKTTFKWLDQKAHDSVYGWYFGWLDSNGNVLDQTKDDNFGMHWMEGMAWLSLVWPDSTLKARVLEMLTLFTSPDWFRSDNDICYYQNRTYTDCNGEEYGHDAELVYLIYTCYQMIGVTPSQTVVSKLKALHGFVETVSTPGVEFENQWWYDAELFASYGSMGALFTTGGDSSDSYLTKCQTHWNFIKAQYFDHTYGGWYYTPYDSTYIKGYEWLATYHAFKCMLFVRNWLFGSQYGWVNPLVSSVKQGENIQAQKNELQPNKTHYIMIMGNSSQLKQATGLYDLMGRSVSLKYVQSRLSNGNVGAVYIVKP